MNKIITKEKVSNGNKKNKKKKKKKIFYSR